MSYEDSNKWKRDTATCFIVVIVMYVFVGLLFGLVFGYVFDATAYLVPRAVGFMFVVSMIAVAVCYATVPSTLHGLKGWTELNGKEFDFIYSRVDRMCDSLGIPTPRIYVSGDRFPNAFAFGKNPKQAHICVTRGLLEMVCDRKLTEDEFFAILGHELCHIAHRDTLVKGVASRCTEALMMSSVLIGAMSVLFLGSVNQSTGKRSGSDAGPLIFILLFIALVFLLFAAILVVTIPGACIITKYAVSRNREYLADEGSARITGDPLALASALQKMDEMCINETADVNAFESMKWTVDPNCRKRRGFLKSLLDTHPSTENRVKRLQKLASELESERVERDPRMIEI